MHHSLEKGKKEENTDRLKKQIDDYDSFIIYLEGEMSDTKYLIFPYITIYDYKSIEDNLTTMAAQGWRTESIGPFLWKFKRSEPSNKKFFAFYSNSKYESASTEEQKLLEELCVKGGWEKEFQWKNMHVFIADHDAMPLEIDEAIKLENIYKNMKKTFIPNGTIVLILMLLIAFINGKKYFGNSPYSDEKTIWAFLLNIYGAFLVGASLLGYLFWIKFLKKKISEGGTCVSTKWFRKILILLLVGFVATSIGILLY